MTAMWSLHCRSETKLIRDGLQANPNLAIVVIHVTDAAALYWRPVDTE